VRPECRLAKWRPASQNGCATSWPALAGAWSAISSCLFDAPRTRALKVVEADRPASVELSHGLMILHLRPGSDKAKRQTIVEEWYREQLRKAVPPLIKNGSG
jgi:hypothetical protein